MEMPKTTAEVAAELDLPQTTVASWIRLGRLQPPAKSRSGNYLWTDADTERLRQLAEQRRRPAAAATG